MKFSVSYAMLILLLTPTLSIGQKADGYYYKGNNNFPPGVYEAIRDAKIYYDIYEKAFDKGILIKKGTRINVYSAGYHEGDKPSIDWFSLDADCNGTILKWDNFGMIFVKNTDFKRIAKLPDRIRGKGGITNCDPVEINSTQPSVPSSSTSILTIKPSQSATPDKNVTKRQVVELRGFIEFGHNAAGGYFALSNEKGNRYILRYVWDLDDIASDQLFKLEELKTKVTVKGTFEISKKGSSGFDDSQPIYIFK